MPDLTPGEMTCQPAATDRALSPAPRFRSRIVGSLGGDVKSYRLFPLFVAALLVATSLSAGHTKNSAYSRVVSIDDMIVHDGSRCAAFASFISSDEFFEGLKATETASGRTFHRRGEEVTVFPDSLSVEIKSSLWDCSTVPPTGKGTRAVLDASRSRRNAPTNNSYGGLLPPPSHPHSRASSAP